MSESNASNNLHINDFLKRNHIGVLATSNPDTNEPHASTIYYATDSKLNFYFLSKEKTTKSRNLTANPQAAIAVYEADTKRTAQIKGYVNKVEDKDMMDRALKLMAKFAKQSSGSEEIPISKLDAGEFILYGLTPQSIRLAEYEYAAKDEIFDVATPTEESLE